MTGKMLHGYLDRLRENVEVLDEAIADARKMSKSKKKGDNPLQWSETLRDFIELRNQTLDRIKAHLLGRDETGAIREPESSWDENPQIMFERYFKDQLSPWTVDDLKLECEDCSIESEDVSSRHFSHSYPESDENLDLCEKCYEKRTVKDSNQADTSTLSEDLQ